MSKNMIQKEGIEKSMVCAKELWQGIEAGRKQRAKSAKKGKGTHKLRQIIRSKTQEV